MSDSGFPSLSTTTIHNFVTAETYRRGQEYQLAGNVIQLETEEHQDGNWLIMASVLGSHQNIYEVIVDCNLGRDGTLLPVTSECTCPVEFDCKHTAAALIALVQRHDQQATVSKTDWRNDIRTLIPKDAEVTQVGFVKPALLFEIKQQRQRGYYYNARPTIENFLSVRIAAPSPTTGKWALNRLSWHDITASSRGAQINPEQEEILYSLWSLYIADNRDAYYDSGNILKLNHFSNNRLWRLLQEAVDSGIPLVTAATSNPPLQYEATCTLELRISEQPTGDLRLAPQLLIDGRATPKSLHPEFIGDPPIGIYWSEGPVYNLKQHTIHLAHFTQQPEASLLKAYRNKTSFDIPAQDKTEFSQLYFPRIARRSPVNTKRVKSIKLTAPELPKLYISVTRAEKQGIKIHLGFAYQGNGQQTIVPWHTANDERIRDTTAERRLHDTLATQLVDNLAWFEETPGPVGQSIDPVLRSSLVLHGLDAVQFIAQTVPRLQQTKDIIMHLDADVPRYSELTGAPNISYDVSQRDDGSHDWFNLAVQVTVGDVTIPFEPLFAALADNQTSLMLDKGQYLMLTHPELLKLRQLILEARQLGDSESSDLSISRFQAGLWDELQQLGVIKSQAEAWESAVRGLLDVRAVPKVAVPKNLKATLRPYQKEGYQWLHFLWVHRLGGILADDMGLGKTLQAIALILAIKAETPTKDRKPVLIVAPTSVAANWQHELTGFAPSLKKASIRRVSKSPQQFAKSIRHADVVLSSYGLFRLDFDTYQKQSWAMLVLDEAQFVKNHQSKGYQNTRKLSADFKLILTGTPLENNLMELWALLSITAPGLFPRPKHFADFYQKPIEKDADNERLQQLRQRVRPLMLRRTKDQVVRELPPKIEQVIELELEPEHRKIYDTHLQRERQRVLGLLGNLDKNRFMIFKSLTTLRLLSLSPSLVDPKKYAKVPSTKLLELNRQLEGLLGEGHRVLIFSQFTKFLKIVRANIEAHKIPYSYLDGSTTNRAQLLEDFKTSNTPVFLISLKAGGFGLNLAEADYCILLDPWWNPAVEAQAIDRAHRIGQTKQVIVYRLVAKDTIEEKVMALKAKKSKLFASMLDSDAAFSSKITAEDIQQLFT